MHTHCRDCTLLIESSLVTEPHRGLKTLLKKPSAEIYQCRHCESCFIYTQHEISLVELDQDTGRGESDSSK